MKKILSVLCLALFACGTMYADLVGKKIYIDPGHGTYIHEDRLMDCIGIPYTSVRDGYGFSESHTNLWKAEALEKKLLAAGASVMKSRNRNGYKQELSALAEEAMRYGADYFISIHSNANYEGAETQYPAFFYKGKENGSYVNGDSKYRAQVLWPYFFEVMDGGASTEFEPNTNYSSTSMCIRADIDFFGAGYSYWVYNDYYTSYYGMLRHGIPGFLAEGFFHTYQPARHRALNADYCRQEGVRYFRGIAKYYGHADDTKGYIMGVVKDGQKTMTKSTTLSATSWNYQDGTHDQYRPIHGAKVTLYTENKLKVAEYTTDNYYNGVFVFNDLTPGTYYLDVKANGYGSLTDAQRKVVVTANKTVYPIVKMSAGTYEEYGDPVFDFKEGWNYSETSGKKASWTSDFTKLRNMTWGDGKLYVVNSVDGKIHVVNAQTGAEIKELDVTGVDGGTIKLIDCHFVDGKLIACNLAATGQALKVYVWDNDNSAPRILLNTTDLGGFSRIGDCITVKNNLTNGALVFACTDDNKASSVVTYAITDGTCSTSPTALPLTKNGAAVNLGPSPRAWFDGTDKWWAMGAVVNPGLYREEDGSHTETIPGAATCGSGGGNDFAHVHWKNKSYGFATTYQNDANRADGCVSVLAPNPGWREGTQLTVFPKAGLGTTKNDTYSTSIATYKRGDESLEVWVLVHKQGIAYYKNGAVQNYEIPGVETPTASISVNPASLSFSGKVGATIASQQVTVTAVSLTEAPTVSSATVFDVTSSLTHTGGTLTITPKAGLAAGEHKETITISGGGVSQPVSLTVTITDDSSSGSDGQIFNFTEGWNYSLTSDKKASWTADFKKLRNLAWGDGKLYVVNTDGKIHVVNAQTGAEIKELDVTGVDGGTFKLSDCYFMDGKLIACNLTTSTSTPLKVYIWDNDDAAPRVLLETTDFGGFSRIGDAVSVKGNLREGALAFVCNNAENTASTIVTYAFTDGICSTSPSKLPLTKGGADVYLGFSPRAWYENGKWWAMGSSANPGLYKDADGTHTETIPAAATGNVVSGNDFAHIHWKNKSYGLATTYAEGTGSESLKAGHVSVIAPSPGWREGAQLATFPSAGLGSERNTTFATSIATNLNGNEGLEVWVLVSYQGIAYYKHGTVKDNGLSGGTMTPVEEVASQVQILPTLGGVELFFSGTEQVAIYNVNGMQVASGVATDYYACNLQAGMYVIRIGEKAYKFVK